VSFVGVIAVVLLLLFANYRELFTRWQRGIIAAGFAAWSAWSALPIFREAKWNLAAPREWDFLCFWLWGKMAALHVDFYDPASALAIGKSFETTDQFSRLILHSGFWYPPPSMLLFAPLGLLPLRSALVIWYLVQAGFAVAAMWLLWRLFLRDQGLIGVVTAGAMVAVLPPARSTAWFAQTNFMLLVLFLLMIRDREKKRAGIFLAMGAIIKPYFLVLLGYFLIKKAYKTVAVAAAALLASLALSAVFFGLAPLESFITSNPTSRIPAYVYGEPINQSLSGMLVRSIGGTLEGSILHQPVYLAIATLLGLTTAWIVRHENGQHGLCLCLLLALLLYPATLAHYSLLLIAPLLALWRDRRALLLGPAGVLGLFAVVYIILGWDRFESHNFWANLLLWGTVAGAYRYLSLRQMGEVMVPARP
jgi:Glycosyltransferase family 87